MGEIPVKVFFYLSQKLYFCIEKNHFMVRREKYNTRLLLWLRLALLALAGFIVLLAVAQFRAEEDEFKESITPLLLQSINEDVSSKMQNKEMFYHKEPDNRPEIGRYVLMTIQTGDTIIEFYRKKEDSLTEVRHSLQSFLTRAYNIDADSVNSLFQDKFNQKGIAAKTFTAVSYDDKTKISGDTTHYSINYNTPIINQGLMGEIQYQGFVSYPKSAIIKRMPKGLILTFLLLEIMLLVVYFHTVSKERKIRPDRILKEKDGNYLVGLVRYDTVRMELHRGDKSVKLTQQQQKILDMLLANSDNSIDKDVLQNTFWTGSTTAYNSMTTAMNRLRIALQDVDSDFNLCTKKGTNRYSLEFNRN